MIAKISATENLGGALGYNFKKVEKGGASILLAAELYLYDGGSVCRYGSIDTEEMSNKKNGVPLLSQSIPGRKTI